MYGNFYLTLLNKLIEKFSRNFHKIKGWLIFTHSFNKYFEFLLYIGHIIKHRGQKNDRGSYNLEAESLSSQNIGNTHLKRCTEIHLHDLKITGKHSLMWWTFVTV